MTINGLFFREFWEDDEMMFGKYPPNAEISEDIIFFIIDGIEYQAKVIINNFKVIIESLATEDLPEVNEHSKLYDNITLEAECLTKPFAYNLAEHLFTTDVPITGEKLLSWGFKIL